MEQIVETFVLVPMLDLDALVPQTVDQLVGVLQILDMSSRVEQAIEVPTIRTGSRGAPWKYLLSCLTQCFQLHSFRGLQEFFPRFVVQNIKGFKDFSLDRVQLRFVAQISSVMDVGEVLVECR